MDGLSSHNLFPIFAFNLIGFEHLKKFGSRIVTDV
jgi:hypothetical protein